MIWSIELIIALDAKITAGWNHTILWGLQKLTGPDAGLVRDLMGRLHKYIENSYTEQRLEVECKIFTSNILLNNIYFHLQQKKEKEKIKKTSQDISSFWADEQ